MIRRKTWTSIGIIVQCIYEAIHVSGAMILFPKMDVVMVYI